MMLIFTGFHNRWNRAVAVRHPSIWTFITKLKMEERHSRRQLHSADHGDEPPAPKRRYRQLQHRIERLQQDYRAGRRNIASYWAAVSHAVHNFN